MNETRLSGDCALIRAVPETHVSVCVDSCTVHFDRHRTPDCVFDCFVLFFIFCFLYLVCIVDVST